MAKESVLIVGAGGLGIITGYHLHLAGAEIHFLVRPARLPQMHEPQILYCYDDHELKEFSQYQAHGSVADATSKPHDYVIITMDGATCRGAEATQLLRELGDAIGETDAIALIAGVGVTDYCRKTMGLPEERVIEGTMGLLSYQTDRVTLPLNPPTDPDKLAKASMAYKHMGKNPGFMLINKPAKPAKAFAELYNRCGVSKCQLMPGKLLAAFAASAFVTMASFDLKGWPHAEELAQDGELMALASRATKEVMRLSEHGLPGKLAALFMSPKRLAKTNANMEGTCLPVDYSAFNQFHHGGKVREQDIGVLRSCLESGKAQGKSMPGLTGLLKRLDAHDQASA